MTKPVRYYIKFPSDAYALGPIHVSSERAARQWAREFAGVKRLPKGFQVWRAE